MLEQIVAMLSGFVVGVRNTVAASAVNLMTELGLILEPDPVTEDQKGSKAVAHNTQDNRYIRVRKPGVDCPILLKPISGKSGFLCWVPEPDADRAKTHDELEAFCKWYMSKAVARHEQYTALSVACTARQLGEDIANNARQAAVRQAKKATENAAKIQAFVALPPAVWKATKAAVEALDPDIVALVETARATKGAKPAQA